MSSYYAKVCGHNQQNVWVCQENISTPTPVTNDTGWWWKGELQIYSWGKNADYHGMTLCDIPPDLYVSPDHIRYYYYPCRYY